MASPAPDTNGISTPPATASAAHTNSPPPSQPQSASQPATTTTTTTAPAPAPSTAYPSSSLLDTGTSKRPRDARLLHLLLSHMGVSAYTERVPLQLLDYAYRYTSSILSDALSYDPPPPTSLPGDKGSKKRDLNIDEVGLPALRTAISARAAGRGAGGKEVLAELAQERNRVALPRVEREFGVRLPGERWCFTGVGWGVGEVWEGEEEVEEVEVERDEGGGFGDEFGADTEMGGMDDVDEDVDEDEFKAVMG